MKVRSSKRSKGTTNVTGNYPILPVYYSQSFLKNTSVLFELHLNHCFPMCQHYHIDLGPCLMSWKLLFLLFPNSRFFLESFTAPFGHHVTSKSSISFPYRALRMASFLTAPADENKGNCILKQRPSSQPHNSCCLWCKYFREVRWPYSMAKAINYHKKYEPPSQWLIACVLHNALFAVSFKQFTISQPNCQSNQGYFKVIFFVPVSLVTPQLHP